MYVTLVLWVLLLLQMILVSKVFCWMLGYTHCEFLTVSVLNFVAQALSGECLS